MDREKLSENVRWILYTSCSDHNVLNRIPLLTDEELRYCLLNEERKTGIKNLLREAKKRKFPISSPPTSPAERFLLYDAQMEELVGLISNSSNEELDFIIEHENREKVKELLLEEKDKRNNGRSPGQLMLF